MTNTTKTPSPFSEKAITLINQNLFFKEFTFDKNNFVTNNGTEVELADNLLWLDDLLIIIQIKEKDKVGNIPIGKWFENKVLKKAKNQIKNTHNLLETQRSITISNGHDQHFEIAFSSIKQIHSVIIYHVAEMPPENVYAQKFYRSKAGIWIHIFTSEDYGHLCRYLITPAELNNYLIFRYDFLSSNVHNSCLPEQYILAHFFKSPDNLAVNCTYISALSAICNAIEQDNSYDLSGFLSLLHDTLKIKGDDNYVHIVKEFAKLNRFDLSFIKEIIVKAITTEVSNEPIMLMWRVVPRIDCGFVVMRLNQHDKNHHLTALKNFTLLFKYKHKLTKCIGLIVKHEGEFFDLDWCYINGPWEYDSESDRLVKEEMLFSPKPQIKGQETRVRQQGWKTRRI